jgi:hypothetical protein
MPLASRMMMSTLHFESSRASAARGALDHLEVLGPGALSLPPVEA